jgi:predicted RNase H-like HicB family nuclease
MRRKGIKLDYSLVIEGTKDPNFFCFYSPNLAGFTGAGKSIDDCLRRAREGIAEHLQVLKEEGFPIPPKPVRPRITTRGVKPSKPVPQNEIHVVPAADGWLVVKVPGRRNNQFGTQREAINHARKLAATATPSSGLVVIHKKDNAVIQRDR